MEPPNPPRPSKKKIFGKTLKYIFQGGSSSGENRNEENQIPTIDFPPNVDEYEERALAPLSTRHISDSTMNLNDKLRFTVRCRMGMVHRWWHMMEERGPTFSNIREIIKSTPFGHLVTMSRGNCDKHLLFALVERWWPTTHTFHFPDVEIGFTPLDFTCLTGLSVGRGEVVPFDSRYDSGEFDVAEVFPTFFSDDRIARLKTKSGIKLQFFKDYFMDPTSIEWSDENGLEPLLIAPGGDEEIEYVYAFLLYLVGGSFFASAHNSIHMGWMAGLTDIQAIGKFDWGGAIMAHLYRCLDDFVMCGNELKQLTGFTWILQ
ncbi:Aminotransferase-like, partial [Thalictrum thalictroides]